MILHRTVRQQNREWHRIEVPAWFALDRVAQRYEQLFGEFDWEWVAERDETGRARGRLPHPQRAYLRSYLVMVEEKIESMPKLRQYLCEHPALVWLIGYRVVSDATSPYGFAVDTSVPSAGHLGAVLRALEERCLVELLAQSAQRTLADDGPGPRTVVLDVKHQYAYVRQNNGRQYVPERFNPARQPRGDRDCRLGFKPCTNQGADPAPGKAKGDYLWGYGSGIAVARTSTKEAVVLADLTLPFNANDVDFASGLLDATIAVLNGLPDALTADAAFDAHQVYAYFLNSPSRVAIPLNLRGHPSFRWDGETRPLCPTDQTPMQPREIRQERGHPRQRFHCPVCGHDHKLFIDPIHLYRWRQDHDTPAFHRLYRQRTVVERVNSLADTYKLTRPHFRRRRSVAHRNTFIYIVLNLHVLQRLRQQHKDYLERPAYAVAA